MLRLRIDSTPAGVTAVGQDIYTSYFACDWMVCVQDASGDKAHMALDLFSAAGRYRPGWTCVADDGIPDGLALYRWRPTRPYFPYFMRALLVRSQQSVSTAQGELLYFNETGTEAALGPPSNRSGGGFCRAGSKSSQRKEASMAMAITQSRAIQPRRFIFHARSLSSSGRTFLMQPSHVECISSLGTEDPDAVNCPTSAGLLYAPQRRTRR